MADKDHRERRNAGTSGRSARKNKTFGEISGKMARGKAGNFAEYSIQSGPAKPAGAITSSVPLKGGAPGKFRRTRGVSGVEKFAREVEKIFDLARREGVTMRLGLTVEPSGVFRIDRPAGTRSPDLLEAAEARPAAEDSAQEPTLAEALARGRERGAVRLAEILGGPEMANAEDFARMIGASRETVNQKRRRHEVLGLEGPKRGLRFPQWQLTDAGELLPGLPELFAEIGDRPWAVYRFLVSEHPELGTTALEAMKHGRAAAAVALAGALGQGAVT